MSDSQRYIIKMRPLAERSEWKVGDCFWNTRYHHNITSETVQSIQEDGRIISNGGWDDYLNEPSDCVRLVPTLFTYAEECANPEDDWREQYSNKIIGTTPLAIASTAISFGLLDRIYRSEDLRIEDGVVFVSCPTCKTFH
jgi:hypothetical protein